MVGHFVTKSNINNEFVDLINQKNHAADVSPTASQMPKLVGLAQASRIYRNLSTKNSSKFSKNGNEIDIEEGKILTEEEKQERK